MVMKGDETLLWVARPQAKACEVPYSPPPSPKNPVVRGLALYWLAKLYGAASDPLGGGGTTT